MKREWVKISEEKGGCYPHPTAIGTLASARSGKIIYELIGQPEKAFFLDSLATYCQGEIAYHYYEDQFDGAARDLFAAIKENPEIAKVIRHKHLSLGKKLIKMGEEIKKIDLTRLDEAALSKIFRRQTNAISDLWAWGLTISILEYKTPYLSSEIEEGLKRKSADHQAHLQLLLTPTRDTYFRKEKINLLKIAREIQCDKKLAQLFITKKYDQIVTLEHRLIDKIIEHNRSFNWINYYYSGPKSEISDHFFEISNHLSLDIDQEISRLENEFTLIKKRQKKLQTELDLEPDFVDLLKIAREFSFLKVFRKDALYHSFHATDLILEEISRRSKVEMLHLRQLLPRELMDILSEKKQIDQAELQMRHDSCLYLVENGQDRFLYGRDMFTQTSRIRKDEIVETSELKGQIANLGKARGQVKIINNTKDLAKMKPGDVLVSIATNPTLVPAMRQAAAIVTDIGGITCHAAIVSRELGVPCVIGTKHATKILKNGDLVEVDADNGTVKIIRENL